ncbi:MAG: hypothetical protein ABIS67_08285, partial [Candidatus Eisenbacteria bacterium]
RSLATISADGTGHLRYEDRDVIAGTRYAYRLGYPENGEERLTAETWVELPAAWTLALEGFRPNPAVGAPVVSLTLANSAPGRIELFDLAGRRVAERDLGGVPAGRHAMKLDVSADLHPWAYVLRLIHGDRVLSSRGVILR